MDPALRELLKDLEQLRGKSRPRAVEHTANPVALPIHIRRDGIELRYFTTLTTLGTPLDVTAQELRIEGYFPMDTATEEFAHTLLHLASPSFLSVPASTHSSCYTQSLTCESDS